MNVNKFVAKWLTSELKETASFQSFFDDLCRLVGHPTPAELDPEGKHFTYEKHVTKTFGEKGFVDAWYRGKFAWEQKGKHKDLEAAYRQLLEYREDLENPPLLVVSDFEKIIIHTNFTNTPKKTYEVHLAELPQKVDILEALFYQPEQLKPRQPEVEASISEEVRPQLSLRFEVLKPPRLYSSYGSVYASGGGPCPPVEGYASLGLVLVNTSQKVVKSIKAELDIQLLRSTRSECRRNFYATGGWHWSDWHRSEVDESVRRFRFDGTSDDVCLHKNELPLGNVEFHFTLPREAIDFQDLVHDSDTPNDSMFLKLGFENPAYHLSPWVSMLQERMLHLYDSNPPAEDFYTVKYEVGAEDFAQFSSEVSLSILWSRHNGCITVG